MNKIKASVLVIDDQQDMLFLCRKVLSEVVTEVVPVSSCDAARAAFHGRIFDVVLTDINIDGDGDGIGLAQEVKNVSPGTSVVIMTADPTIETAIGGLKSGAVEYIIKPFSPDYLESVIRNTLEKVRLKSDLETARAFKAELEAAYAQLKNSERVKDAFLARLNHELRTPLSIALASSELLGSELGEAALSEMWRRSDKGLKNLRLAIEELLLFSDLLKENIKLVKTGCDLWALLGEAVKGLKFLYEDMALDVELTRDGVPFPVLADAELMSAVFRQLFTNAVKFNKKGGSIALHAVYQPDRVLISFSDTGCGVSDAAMPHLFEGFFQAADYLTREVGGIGLGLATVKHIVEAHGGLVSVYRNQGVEGMTFSVSLPRGEKAGT